MILLVDNSNRTTKLAAGDASGVREASLRRVPSAGLSPDVLQAASAGLPSCSLLASCSVTADGPAVLAGFAAARGLPLLALDHSTAELDFSGYPDPAGIGPDRLANALAAAARFPDDVVIAIDAGTAITFNVVAPGSVLPRFLGGAIAPGAAAFTGWLASRTARLPEIDFPAGDVPAVATTTTAAMQAAARHGLAGMLREILRVQQLDHPGARVIATGTDGALVAGLLGASVMLDPWLTLDGLRRAGLAAGAR